MSLRALIIEHDAITDAEAEEPGSERPHRTDKFEDYYVGQYTLKIFENLRFYKRRKGKRAGQAVPLYVNPKTGKAMKNPTTTYLAEVYKKIDAVKYNFDPTVLRHLKDHIKQRILKNQRETITRLRKEKERLGR